MRGSRRLLLAAAAFALAAAASAAPVRPSKQYTIEELLDTVSIRDASFSFDETTVLFSSNRTGIYNEANQITAWRAVLDFLDRYLRAQPAKAAAR